MNNDLAKRFELHLYEYYRRAKDEAKYNAVRFLHMLDANGGLETARLLINSPKESEGYTTLYLKGRLDITVEALIFDHPEYQTLFTNDELKKVKKRLKDYRYKPALE